MVEITSEEQNKKEWKELRTVSETSGTYQMQQYSNYRGQGYEKIFEEIIVENFPNMEKETVNQVQEAKESHTGETQGETRQNIY